MAAVHGERGLPRPAWPLGCAQPTICYFLCVRKCRRADSRPIAHRCTRIYAPVALENHLADKEPRRTCTSPVSESSEIPFIPTMKAIFVGALRAPLSKLPSLPSCPLPAAWSVSSLFAETELLRYVRASAVDGSARARVRRTLPLPVEGAPAARLRQR